MKKLLFLSILILLSSCVKPPAETPPKIKELCDFTDRLDGSIWLYRLGSQYLYGVSTPSFGGETKFYDANRQLIGTADWTDTSSYKLLSGKSVRCTFGGRECPESVQKICDTGAVPNAIRNKDITVCQRRAGQLLSEEIRQRCVEIVISELKNPALCDKLTDLRDFCQAKAAGIPQ